MKKQKTPDLPPISEQMQDFLTKSFQKHPGRPFYHLDAFAADIEAQLVSRGLVIREEFESKGKTLVRYRGVAPAEVPPALDMNAQA
jgi:BMFP domain-containing protein YqiC